MLMSSFPYENAFYWQIVRIRVVIILIAGVSLLYPKSIGLIIIYIFYKNLEFVYGSQFRSISCFSFQEDLENL